MSDISATSPVTIGSLRDQHLKLMQEWRGLPDDSTRVSLATALRLQASKAGADISTASERDEAQGIIDYWGSSISSLPGQAYPELIVVTPYEGKQTDQAARSAEQVYDALDSPEKQRIAQSIFGYLFKIGPDEMVDRVRPSDRDTLLRNAGLTDTAEFDSVVAQFVATGAIVVRPGDAPDSPRYEAADPRIAETWPTLRKWLDAARDYNARRDRIMLAATRWLNEGKRAEQLLNKRDLENAAEFRLKSDLLDDYIAASRRAQFHRVVVFRSTAVTIVICIAAIALLGEIYLTARHDLHQTSQDRDQYKAQNDITVESPENARSASLGTASVDVPVPTPRLDSELAKVPELQGAMWLGSDTLPQVMNQRGGSLGKLANLPIGTLFRARAPISLRQDWPVSNDDYSSPTRTAVVARNGLIELRGQVRSYDRTTGVQYWAKVRVIPEVFVQYANASRDQINAVRREIARAGFEVPAADAKPDAGNRAQVRYFRPEDRNAAALLVKTLEGIDAVRSGGAIACNAIKSPVPVTVSFQLEFWFDPTRKNGNAPVARCNDSPQAKP
ncbi:MAG: hypothetical protein ABI810_19275 [Sphingomonas bacterium]